MLGLHTAVGFFKEVEKEAFKAIDRYNLTKGLKGSAKETWGDILEFKQYFEETHRIDPKMLEIEDVTDQDLFGDDIVQAWAITQHFSNGEVQYYLTVDDEGNYFLCDMEGDEASPYYTEPFIKAVKNWEVKKGLKGDAKDTWENILESVDLSDITIKDIKFYTRGNITSDNTYWKRFYFTLNGKNYRIEFRAFKDGTPFYFRWENPTPITPYKVNSFFESIDGSWSSWKKVDKQTYKLDQFIITELLKKERSYEIKKGLKGSAEETWGDILESKEYEKEATRMAPENVSIKVLGVNHEEPEQGYDVYDLLLNGQKAQFVFYPNDKEKSFLHEYPDWMCNKISSTEDEHGNDIVNAEEWEIDDYWVRRGPVRDTLNKRIVNAIVTHGLKGSAKETWGDILESKANDTTIKVLKGPYGHIWRNQYDIKEHADECYDIEMWGCNIIWAQDQRWIVPEKDYREWSRNFVEYKSLNDRQPNVAELIEKAIKSYNVKKGLKDGAKETWSDILEFKDYFQG